MTCDCFLCFMSNGKAESVSAKRMLSGISAHLELLEAEEILGVRGNRKEYEIYVESLGRAGACLFLALNAIRRVKQLPELSIAQAHGCTKGVD